MKNTNAPLSVAGTHGGIFLLVALIAAPTYATVTRIADGLSEEET